MNEPAPPDTSEAYAERLVARLDVLHRCYEDAMAELGLPRAVPAVPSEVSAAERKAEQIRR